MTNAAGRTTQDAPLARLRACTCGKLRRWILGSAATISAALLVVDMPPPLRAEAHRIKSMLIVACERVVVAVAMGNAIVMISANMPPMSSRICRACLPQGECQSESWEDYILHRGLDVVALELNCSWDCVLVVSRALFPP